MCEALVAQWVKRWPTDLLVFSITNSLSLSPAHCPDTAEKDVKSQGIHPSIHPSMTELLKGVYSSRKEIAS